NDPTLFDIFEQIVPKEILGSAGRLQHGDWGGTVLACGSAETSSTRRFQVAGFSRQIVSSERNFLDFLARSTDGRARFTRCGVGTPQTIRTESSDAGCN
ncbi:MAG: hypothetical protein WD873_01470, partial [Candidatus Hydrogenedentales bacterium]